MIRLSVDQLNELEKAIKRTGEVKATILPKKAFTTDRLVIAWARSVNQEEFFLSIWQNQDSWDQPKGPKTLLEVFDDEEEKDRDLEFENSLNNGPQMVQR